MIQTIRESVYIRNCHVELTLPEYLNNSEVEITIKPTKVYTKRINESNSKLIITKRPLGLLKGKASYRIHDDFSITDEELIALWNI